MSGMALSLPEVVEGPLSFCSSDRAEVRVPVSIGSFSEGVRKSANAPSPTVLASERFN